MTHDLDFKKLVNACAHARLLVNLRHETRENSKDSAFSVALLIVSVHVYLRLLCPGVRAQRMQVR
ncbi:hypothetical protein D918_06451 [Trichuris suis]|nr:hypothetical protein D918_06451 [Trichuris suis]